VSSASFVGAITLPSGVQMATVTTAFACFFGAGYLYTLTSSGDTNSMVGVFCAGLALAGSHAARQRRRWGGPLMLAALTVALGSHAAFAVYAGLYLLLESIYFRDRAAFVRLALASGFATIAALPVHWESLRYPEFVSLNNTVYQHGEPIRWGQFARNAFYNVEILALPQRWFNDYRSLANVWLLPMLLVAATGRATRIGFYAACAVLTQALLRLNTPVAGAMFDRIQHMLPLLVAPAMAGLVLRHAGRRSVAIAIAAVLSLYVATSFEPTLALDGGSDGLEVIGRLLDLLPDAMADDGEAMLEIGADQGQAIVSLIGAKLPGWSCTVELDLAGLPRVARIARPPASESA
jgi:hypothetical protein